MKNRVARRVAEIPPSGIRAFFELVLGMPDVLSLGVGEPDFVTPWAAREAAITGLERGYTRYSSNWGLLELREEIVRYIRRRGGPLYDPRREVLVTVGVSEGMDIAFRAILDPGDEVIHQDPCFVSYAPIVHLAGGVPVAVPTTAADGWRLTPEAIERAVTPRTKAILLNYPANPTGGTLARTDLEAIAEIARARDLLVVSDEIYDRLTFRGTHTVFSSLPGMRDRTIYLNGFSKAFAMTGWRIGWLAGPAEIVEAACKIHQYSMMCSPIASQIAALEALRSCEDRVLEMSRSFAQRRRLISKGLSDLGLECPEPDGAFYAFPSIRSTGLDSEAFARRLLEEEKVAVVPGAAFGRCGEGHVRLAYAASVETIREALRRIGRMVERAGTRRQAASA